MKLNPDCMRDILIFAESIEYGTQSTLTKLSKALPQIATGVVTQIITKHLGY